MRLDGITKTANGNSGNILANVFNICLFSQEGLDLNSEHQMVLWNNYTTVSPSYVDVDYIVVTVGDDIKR